MDNKNSRIANMNVREFKEALIKLNRFPDSHGYSESEVNELLTIESEFKATNEKISNNVVDIANKISNGFEALNKALTVLFSVSMYQMKHMVANGWYISPTVFSDVDLGTLIEYTKQENVNQFEAYIENRLTKKAVQQIIDKIKNDFPERASIFNEMNNLFVNEFYYSFINLCYTQADGICNGKWQVGFFDTDKKNNYLLTLPNKLGLPDESISNMVATQLSLNKNEFNEHKSKFNETEKRTTYNRHMVLHGHSNHYGNKKNAIRAILLLEFVHWLTLQNNINKAL